MAESRVQQSGQFDIFPRQFAINKGHWKNCLTVAKPRQILLASRCWVSDCPAYLLAANRRCQPMRRLKFLLRETGVTACTFQFSKQ
jgi:hypothetical protein